MIVLSICMLHVGSARTFGQTPEPFEGPLVMPPRTTSRIVLEAELFVKSVATSAGKLSLQNVRAFGLGWRRYAQIFWDPAIPGPHLRMRLWAGAGRYHVFLVLTKAADYGLVRTSFDGAPSVSFNGYSRIVRRDRLLLGTFDLTSEMHEILLQVVGRDPKSAGFRVGLDRIDLQPATN